MIDPTDPFFILFLIFIFLGFSIFLLMVWDLSRDVSSLKKRNRFLENILNEKCPDWRHDFSETVYPNCKKCGCQIYQFRHDNTCQDCRCQSCR